MSARSTPLPTVGEAARNLARAVQALSVYRDHADQDVAALEMRWAANRAARSAGCPLGENNIVPARSVISTNMK
jgi:hypothetical protein